MWRAMGRVYHKNCFTCTVCSSPFPDGQFFAESRNPYCEEHFLEMFGSKCYRCDEFVNGDVLTALDKTWHLECFVCDGCGEGFPDLNYFGHGNRAYCKECYCKRYADKCPGCGKFVVGNAVQITDPTSNKNVSWHVECLTCTRCNCSLGVNDEIFINDKDGQPYCAKDFKDLYANFCNACGKIIEEDTMAEVDDGHGGVQKYHMMCFTCIGCDAILEQSFFNVDMSLRVSKLKGEPNYCKL